MLTGVCLRGRFGRRRPDGGAIDGGELQLLRRKRQRRRRLEAIDVDSFDRETEGG
jgi:hypothetical protein